MTREEAAIKSCEDRIKHLKSAPTHHYGKRQRERAIELEKVKIKALRPVSREQVERMRGVGEKGGPAMTREKAITILQREKDCVQQAIQNAVDGDGYVSPDGMIRAEDYVEACVTALTALRPVSREQVEKVWRGVWKHYLPPLGAGNIQCRCTKCGRTPDVETPFCAWCGAPMTDEAVEMVMERLEALKDGKGD